MGKRGRKGTVISRLWDIRSSSYRKALDFRQCQLAQWSWIWAESSTVTSLLFHSAYVLILVLTISPKKRKVLPSCHRHVCHAVSCIKKVYPFFRCDYACGLIFFFTIFWLKKGLIIKVIVSLGSLRFYLQSTNQCLQCTHDHQSGSASLLSLITAQIQRSHLWKIRYFETSQLFSLLKSL